MENKQRLKDLLSVALLILFSVITFVGIYMLDSGAKSTIAIAATTGGIIGVLLSLVVAVILILSNE